MSDERNCPDCGSTLPPDAPRGLCPRCLMNAALGPPPSGGPDTTVVGPHVPGVLDTIAQSVGLVPRVLLRDTTPGEEPGPLVRPDVAPADPTLRYRIDGEIARGGMGAVLKGRDPDLGRDVALKVLREDLRDRPDLVRRFVEEAQIGGQLQHPGIVPIYELGTFADRRPFFSMKLVKGQTLAALLGGRRNPAEDLPRLLGIFEQISQTVAYAHARGVIHRDLKPSNVMVGSFGEVQVMDWGLAKVLLRGGVADDAKAGKESAGETVIETARSGSDADQSRAGSILGTPSYMAPEQARGETDILDERCDVFALGSMLCEVLTGTPAFTGRSTAEIVRSAARGDVGAALARLDACGADAELTALAMDCLAPLPEGRPRDASVVAERMAAHLAGVQERLRAAERERAAAEARAIEQAKRRRMQAALGLTFTGLVLLGGGFAWWTADQRQARRLETERAVNRSLETAAARLGQARGADGDPALLAEARAAALQARERAGDGVPVEVRGRVEAILADLDQADKNRRLVADLREIHTGFGEAPNEQAQGFIGASDVAGAADRYHRAFLEYGVEPGRLDPDRAADMIRDRAGDFALELATALDDWAYCRKRLEKYADYLEGDLRDSIGSERLFDVTRRLDPDPVRNRIRVAAARSDGPALSALADELDPATQPSSTIVLLGLSLSAAGRIDKAVRFWTVAQPHHPEDFRINAGLADNFRYQNRLDEGLPYATAAVALRPRNKLALEDLAAYLIDMRRYEEAAAVALRMPLELPRDWTSLVAIGGQLEDQGERAIAIALYRKAAEAALEHPADSIRSFWSTTPRSALSDIVLPGLKARLEMRPEASAHFTLGTFLSEAGQRDAAIAEYREAIRRKPGDAADYLAFGRLLGRRGKTLDEAITAWREVLRRKPGDATTLLAMSAALIRERRAREMLEDAREGVRLHPENAINRGTLARVLAASGDRERAIATLRESIRVRPDYALSYAILARFLSESGDHEAALAELRRAFRLSPGEFKQHIELNDTFLRLGKHAEAIAFWREAIDADPDNARHRSSFAMALEAQGKSAEAITELREALRLKANAGEIHLALGRCFGNLGRYDEAVAEFREALRLKYGNPEIHLYIAETFGAAGRVDEGIATLRDWIREFPGNRIRLGEYLTQYGRYEEAIAELQRVLGEVSPDSPAATQAADALRIAERRQAILSRLPGLFEGKDRPKDDAERLELGEVCYRSRRYASAARFSFEAFQSEPKLADDLKAGHRYNAACSAALAGCGQGTDAPADEPGRAALRRQALDWLRADLALRRKQWNEGDSGRQEATRALQHWMQDPDFAAVRNPESLAKLPEAERADWQALWAEVSALLDRGGSS